jgi:hypothetical protein
MIEISTKDLHQAHRSRQGDRRYAPSHINRGMRRGNVKLCIFPACTDGDLSLTAFNACRQCSLFPPPQHAAHVDEYKYRKHSGLMVLRPYPLAVIVQPT